MAERLIFRRTDEAPRVEIVPLIDVIFLVLTFFIYAMVLMIPAKVLPMQLQALAGGEQGRPAPAVAISITSDGRIAVDRQEVTLESLREAVLNAVKKQSDAVVYVAWDREGSVDRLGLFGQVMDRLANSGLDVRIVGRPPGE